jgi:uncharacterized membrane protein HdeD (DUF308 family)
MASDMNPTGTRPVTSSAGATSSYTAPVGDQTARIEAMSALLAQNWWAVALRGVFGILFGLIALIVPGAAILSLALLFGAYLLVDGVFAIISAVRAAQHHQRWGLFLAEGVLDLVMGVIALLFPVSAVLAFVIITAAWALLTGGLMLGAAFRLGPAHGRWWLILSGITSIIFGILLAIAPLIGALVLTWWLGAYALVFGAMLIGLAFRLRSRKNESGLTAARA